MSIQTLRADNETASSANHFSIITAPEAPVIAFRDHPLFGRLNDIFHRYHTHHAVIETDLPYPVLQYFLLGFKQYSNEQHVIVLNLMKTISQLDDLTHDLETLRRHLVASNHPTVFACLLREANHSVIDLLISKLTTHPAARLLILSPQAPSKLFSNEYFTHLTFPSLAKTETQAILKQYALELMHHHPVDLPESLLTQAYELAGAYLSAVDPLRASMQLLDSAAGNVRGETLEGELKPIVTDVDLRAVIHRATDIPREAIQIGPIHAAKLLKRLPQSTLGQDAALTTLAEQFTRPRIALKTLLKPRAFLFAGPNGCGKTTTALALAEALSLPDHAIFTASSTHAMTLRDLRLQRHSDQRLVELAAIAKTVPQAFIFIPHLQLLNADLLADLSTLLTTGMLIDEQPIYCPHLTLVFTTNLGTNRLQHLSKPAAEPVEMGEMNLLQLVMSQPNHSSFQPLDFSPGELSGEMLPELKQHFSLELLNALTIIPFLPLDQSVQEKIIKLKLQHLQTDLTLQHGIELSIAPEALRFLMGQLKPTKKRAGASVGALLQQVDQAIFSHLLALNNANRPLQLHLHLNENGDRLLATAAW